VVKITAGGTRTLVGGGLFHPDSVALATDGTAYTYDEDGTIAKISSGGVVSTFATGVSDGPAVDASGNVYAAVGNEIDEFTPAGARSTFATGLSIPSSLVFGPEGDLYVDNRGTDELLAIDQSGNATVFASGPVYGTASDDAAFLAVGVPEPELLALSTLSLLAFRRGHRVHAKTD
jgi:sugar lactone lactonase YvrE